MEKLTKNEAIRIASDALLDKMVAIDPHYPQNTPRDVTKVLDALGISEIDLREALAERNKRRPKCALIIGHSKQSQGASNPVTGLTEFAFNDELAQSILKHVDTVEVKLIYRESYDALAKKVNLENPDFVISLHCNAFNTAVRGCEMLYHYNSKKGKAMAQILQDHIIAGLAWKDRGIKPKVLKDRGGYLLKYTDAPCVIAEPFFIDNDFDCAEAVFNRERLAGVYALAIEEIGATLV